MLNNIIPFFAVAALLLSCKGEQDAQRPVNHSSGNFIKQSVERNKKIYQEQETLFMDLFKRDSIQYVDSKNGFWYTILSSNDSIPFQPITKGDIITYDYQIRKLDNELVYPEDQFRNQKYHVDKENIISGLRLGLKFLKKHDIARFYFPSEKAYGFHGDDNKIATNYPLIFDVKIKDIEYQHMN